MPRPELTTLKSPTPGAQSAVDWLISCGTQLAAFKAQDRAELVRLMHAGDRSDAVLMEKLALNRYRFPKCREHWRRAFIGLSLDEAWGGGTIDMGPDQAAHQRKHPGCGKAWE